MNSLHPFLEVVMCKSQAHFMCIIYTCVKITGQKEAGIK